MSYELRDIVEVVDAHPGPAGTGGANDYFEHGYQLLAIESESNSGKHPGPAGQYYVRRKTRVIVGRTAEVEHWAPAPRRTPPDGEALTP